jgi:hypothetical protein
MPHSIFVCGDDVLQPETFDMLRLEQNGWWIALQSVDYEYD